MHIIKEQLSRGITKNTKPYKGPPMEGMIARWYDKNRRSTSDQERLSRKVRETLPKGGRVLEVAPGPGYLAIDLAKSGIYQVVGLDISKTFVEIARAHAEDESVDVNFRHGNASNMPFDDESFDFVICVAAFKNFSEPVQAIDEMHRVLKSGGKALIVDLRKGSSLQEITTHIKHDMGLHGINAFFTKSVFKYFLLKNAYTKAEMEELVSQTRFTQCDIREDTISLEICLTK